MSDSNSNIDIILEFLEHYKPKVYEDTKVKESGTDNFISGAVMVVVLSIFTFGIAFIVFAIFKLFQGMMKETEQRYNRKFLDTAKLWGKNMDYNYVINTLKQYEKEKSNLKNIYKKCLRSKNVKENYVMRFNKVKELLSKKIPKFVKEKNDELESMFSASIIEKRRYEEELEKSKDIIDKVDLELTIVNNILQKLSEIEEQMKQEDLKKEAKEKGYI